MTRFIYYNLKYHKFRKSYLTFSHRFFLLILYFIWYDLFSFEVGEKKLKWPDYSLMIISLFCAPISAIWTLSEDEWILLVVHNLYLQTENGKNATCHSYILNLYIHQWFFFMINLVDFLFCADTRKTIAYRENFKKCRN